MTDDELDELAPLLVPSRMLGQQVSALAERALDHGASPAVVAKNLEAIQAAFEALGRMIQATIDGVRQNVNQRLMEHNLN